MNDKLIPIEYIKNQLKDVYSTNEVDTGKTWIDGKKIYRKTYQVTSLINGNNFFGDTSTIENFINFYGTVYRTNGNHFFIPYIGTNDTYINLSNDGATYNQFNLYMNNVSNILKAHITIEYTKTTD